jgi:hypothetical protein
LGGSVFFFFQWNLVYSLAFGLIVAMLGNQVEAYFAARRAARLESQLADGIDLIVGALGAGTSVNNAIDVAIRETTDPLRGQLQEVAGRIRLGDDPVEVFRDLADRVPTETFLLFSSALSVHWEVGGRLAPTLAIVGRMDAHHTRNTSLNGGLDLLMAVSGVCTACHKQRVRTCLAHIKAEISKELCFGFPEKLPVCRFEDVVQANHEQQYSTLDPMSPAVVKDAFWHML